MLNNGSQPPQSPPPQSTQISEDVGQNEMDKGCAQGKRQHSRQEAQPKQKLGVGSEHTQERSCAGPTKCNEVKGSR